MTRKTPSMSSDAKSDDGKVEKSNSLHVMPSGTKETIYTILGKAALNQWKYSHKGTTVGGVAVWADQAISVEDEEGINKLKADLDTPEKNAVKGFAMRFVVEGEEGTQHVSMSVPFMANTPNDKISDKIDEHGHAYIDYMENHPEFKEKIKCGLIMEILPFITYSTVGRKVIFPKESAPGEVDVRKHINGVVLKQYGFYVEEGDSQVYEKVGAFSGELKIDNQIEFGLFSRGPNMSHVSGLVRSSNGKTVKLSSQLNEARLQNPFADQFRTRELTPQHNPAKKSRINTNDFAEKIDGIYERLEALERRERYKS